MTMQDSPEDILARRLDLLQQRVAQQEAQIHRLETRLRQQTFRRRTPLMLILALLLALLGGTIAGVPTTTAQQPEIAKAPMDSGGPLLLGRDNLPSIVNGEVERTLVTPPTINQIAPRLFHAANISNSDVATFFPVSQYRIALLASTSGRDVATRTRIGVAAAVDTTEATSNGGMAVYGYATGPNAYGIWGQSTDGVGAILRGGQAPLRLFPSLSSGPPTSGIHGTGELYVSMEGNLYFCTEGGSPGRWTKLNVVQSYIPRVQR